MTSNTAKAPHAHIIGERWQLVRPLAQGGMSEVWVARHVITGRIAALKMLESKNGEEILERFRREAAVTTELRHPGIVEVLDAGFADVQCTFFIAMELLDGSTLEEKMADPSTTPGEILHLLVDILEPLSAAHERGVIHRDLKPANIFIESGGCAKLLDFGIARKTSAAGMTMTGTVMGTPYYMSPEQALDSRKVSPLSDIWSVGVMIYEGLSGFRPFTGCNSHAVIVSVCTEDHRPLCEVVPSIDADLSALVDRCLSKDADLRPQTALALKKELLPFLRSPTIPPTRQPSIQPEAPQQMTGSRIRVLSRRPQHFDSSPQGSFFFLMFLGALLLASGVTLSLAAFAFPSLRTAWLLLPWAFGLVFWAFARLILDRQKRASIRAHVSRRPKPLPIESDDKGVPCFGNEHAAVTILVFGEIRGPESNKCIDLSRDIVNEYGDVRILWRILAEDEGTDVCAEAACEVFAQGGNESFWGFHRNVSKLRKRPSKDDIESIAKDLELHPVGLRHALLAGRHKARLNANRELARAFGVQGKCGMFINGQVLSSPTHQSIKAIVEPLIGIEKPFRVSDVETLPGRMHMRAGLRYIVVKWRGIADMRGEILRTKAQARERAEKILARAMMSETNFATLGRQFGDDSVDLGTVAFADLAKPLRMTAADLRIDEISPLIETENGYFIIKRYG